MFPLMSPLLQNVISNYIYAEKLIGANGTDSIPDPSNPAPAFKFSSGKTLVWGGELYFDVHPHPLDWLHLANSFSFVESKQQNQSDSTKYLPFTPAPKYRGEIRVHLKTMGKYISNAYVKIAVDHFSNKTGFTVHLERKHRQLVIP